MLRHAPRHSYFLILNGHEPMLSYLLLVAINVDSVLIKLIAGAIAIIGFITTISSIKEWFHKSTHLVKVPKNQKEIDNDKRIYENALFKYKTELNEYNRIVLENEKRQKEIQKSEAEKKRIEESKYEHVSVMCVIANTNGKYSAIIRRANNTYTGVERPNTTFFVGEILKLTKEKCDTFNWYSESEYNKQEAARKHRETLQVKIAEESKRRSKYLGSFGIEYLYHMTHRNNLQNILQNGLQSHNQARTNGLTQVDIADNQVNDRRSRLEPIYNRSIHDYVPLYFNPKNPMLFKRSNLQDEIVILAIYRLILYRKGTLFTDGNAAAKATTFFNNLEELKQLNWECLNTEYWNDFADGKRIKCAEVLIYPDIPTVLVQKIFCKTVATKQFVENRIVNYPQIRAEVNENLYFDRINNRWDNQNGVPANFRNINKFPEPDDDLPF